jgi:hypothetical protein
VEDEEKIGAPLWTEEAGGREGSGGGMTRCDNMS